MKGEEITLFHSFTDVNDFPFVSISAYFDKACIDVAYYFSVNPDYCFPKNGTSVKEKCTSGGVSVAELFVDAQCSKLQGVYPAGATCHPSNATVSSDEYTPPYTAQLCSYYKCEWYKSQ